MWRMPKLFDRKYIRFWILVVGVVVAAFSFEEVIDDVFYDPREGDIESRIFDESIMSFVDGVRSEQLTQIMTDMTALGSFSVILAFFFAVSSMLIIYRHFSGLAYLIIVLAGAGLWPLVLKQFFQRARPDQLQHLVNVADLSFPSGHAFGATSVYLAMAFYSKVYGKTWQQEIFFYFLAALMITIVGFSRIYLGVHYPTDVLRGISSGAIWALSVSTAFELLHTLRRPKVPSNLK
jgi:undecaprenyl-diphosphatase